MTILAKIPAPKAAAICENYEVEEPARALLTPTQTPQQFIDTLIAKELCADACRFLAQALPKREAIWWAWQCAAKAAPPKAPDKAAAALQLVEKWILKPIEPNRRPAMEAAEAAGIGTPAGSTALAVFFSGGSMAPPDLPPVAPPEHLAGVAAGNAVILSALLGEPDKATARYHTCLNLGLEIATGTNRWREPAR
jgi:uncharacterized protein DUF6931